MILRTAGIFISLILLVATGCSSGTKDNTNNSSADFSNGSLFDGYVLTNFTFKNSDNTELRVVITYDFEASTAERTVYGTDGTVNFRNDEYFDSNGYLIKSDSYSASGDLRYTDTFTIEEGLITERLRSTGERLQFEYTDNGVIAKRIHSGGNVDDTVVFQHNDLGQPVAASSTLTADSSYEFNNAGQLTLADYGTSTENYFYDSSGKNTLRTTRYTDQSTRESTYVYSATSKPIINYRLISLKLFL